MGTETADADLPKVRAGPGAAAAQPGCRGRRPPPSRRPAQSEPLPCRLATLQALVKRIVKSKLAAVDLAAGGDGTRDFQVRRLCPDRQGTNG